MLDTALREDASLIHTGHAPENHSVMRKLAMALLKKAGSQRLTYVESRKPPLTMMISYAKFFLSAK